jgi:type II secretory pathway component PulF
MNTGHLQTFMFMLNRAEPVRQMSLLMVLASGIGDSDTLIEGLRTHAAESQMPWSGRIGTLLAKLETGMPLSAALHSDVGLLPDSTVAAIHVAEQNGTLRDILMDEAHRLAAETERSRSESWDPLISVYWLLMVGSTLMTVTTFIMYYIIPKFARIFEDFGVELPAMTRGLIRTSNAVIDFSPFFALPFTAAVMGGFWYGFRSLKRRISRGGYPLDQHFPRLHVPALLRLLSFTTAAGGDHQKTVHIFQSELEPGRASQQFSRLRMMLLEGVDFTDALQRTGLVKEREAAFLNATRRNGHLDWGLLQLSRTLLRQRFRSLKFFGRFLEPAIVLAVGVAVGMFAVAMMLPLIKLINDLS